MIIMKALSNKAMYQKACEVAMRQHKGQYRDDGITPFISHPIAVAERLMTAEEKTVAMLHDVVEETDIKLSDLFKEGFNTVVVRAVESLTRIPGELYPDYIERVILNKLAIRVKLADISHNLETLEGADISWAKRKKRREKYLYFRKVLISHL